MGDSWRFLPRIFCKKIWLSLFCEKTFAIPSVSQWGMKGNYDSSQKPFSSFLKRITVGNERKLRLLDLPGPAAGERITVGNERKLRHPHNSNDLRGERITVGNERKLRPERGSARTRIQRITVGNERKLRPLPLTFPVLVERITVGNERKLRHSLDLSYGSV